MLWYYLKNLIRYDMGNLWIPGENKCCFIKEDGHRCKNDAVWRIFDIYNQYTELCYDHMAEIIEDTDNIEEIT